MNSTVVEILAEAFSALSKEEFRRLRRRLKRKDITIACGPDAGVWWDCGLA